MKKRQEQLIEELKKDVEIMLSCAESIKKEKDAMLVPPAKGKWSVAQILEHVNSYGRHYLPHIDKAVSASQTQRDAWFNSGLLGNYFTNIIKPKNIFEVGGAMKSPKEHVYDNSTLNPDSVVYEFVVQQQKLLLLLEMAKDKSLNTIKVPISISRYFKLKLGDTFRFVIAHEQRHMIQARNALKAIGVATDKFPVILREGKQ